MLSSDRDLPRKKEEARIEVDHALSKRKWKKKEDLEVDLKEKVVAMTKTIEKEEIEKDENAVWAENEIALVTERKTPRKGLDSQIIWSKDDRLVGEVDPALEADERKR